MSLKWLPVALVACVPRKEHVIEQVKKQSAQEDDEGGPDKAGK